MMKTEALFPGTSEERSEALAPQPELWLQKHQPSPVQFKDVQPEGL